MGGSRASLGHASEIGGKYVAQEGIVMGVDHHLDLISSKVLDVISHSDITVEARYHELLWKLMRHVSFERGELEILRMEDLGPRGLSPLISFLIISTSSSCEESSWICADRSHQSAPHGVGRWIGDAFNCP